MARRATTSGEDSIITGCGWVTAHAAGTIEAVLAAAEVAAHHGNPSTTFLPVPEALLWSESGLPAEVTKDKGTHMAAVAVRTALQDAGIGSVDESESATPGMRASVPRERIGLVLGSSLAGQLGMMRFATEVRAQSARFVSPIHFPQTVGNYIAGALARAFDFRGPNITVAGPTAGLAAIHEACALLAANEADVVLAGATEELSDSLAGALALPDVLLCEGACSFVVERDSQNGAGPTQARARITRSSVDVGHGTQRDTALDTLYSVCEPNRPGAICIPAWIGHDLSVAGPSALAAAIGALSGLHVPVGDPRASSGVIAGIVAPQGEAGTRIVIAQSHEGSTTRLEVELHRPVTGPA